LSYLAASNKKQNTLDFKICLRNVFPSHLPLDAHCISQGISITLKLYFQTVTDHKFGIKVVKGYSATLAFVCEIAFIREDFPTLGVPIKATSANSCNSRVISLFCHGSQSKQKVGY